MVQAAQWVASFLFLAVVAAALGWAIWRWRKYVLLGFLAIVGVLLVAGGAFFAWQWKQGHDAEVAAAAAAAAQRQTLRDSAVTVSVEKAPPIPEFADSESRMAYLRWLGAMSERLSIKIQDWPTRKEFLQTIWYESRRAGLDVSLTLALVETLSNFRHFYVSENGARGYFAVNPEWSSVIGDGDPAKLFHRQTNMRFGTVIIRHYLDEANGDVTATLERYVANSLAVPITDAQVARGVKAIYAAQRRWVYVDAPPTPGAPPAK